jgi:transcriptional regulator with XRE-family HTH domain
MSMADRLRQAREAAGLSQGQVAKKLEMHRPTISEIEAGRRKVSAEEVGQFAEIYGVALKWIISGPTENEPNDVRVLVAARELSKMSEADLERLMKTLQMIRKPENP